MILIAARVDFIEPRFWSGYAISPLSYTISKETNAPRELGRERVRDLVSSRPLKLFSF
jgi:hypothetical protein